MPNRSEKVALGKSTTNRSGPVITVTFGTELPSMAMLKRFSLKLTPFTIVKFLEGSTGGTTSDPPFSVFPPELPLSFEDPGVIRYTLFFTLSHETFNPNCSLMNRIGTSVVLLRRIGAVVSVTVLSSTDAIF
ncbi:hypothetical protein D3C71_1363530 [compost metagenome]